MFCSIINRSDRLDYPEELNETMFLTDLFMWLLEQVNCIYIDIDDPDNIGVLESFNLEAWECPTYRYIIFGETMQKYRPETTEITACNVRQFVQNIQDGKQPVDALCCVRF